MREGLSNNGLYTVGWLCFTIIACSITGSILYYHINKPTQYEVMLKLADEGYSPAVLKCSFNISWQQTGDYEICRRVLLDNNLTPEEAEALIRRLESGGVD